MEASPFNCQYNNCIAALRQNPFLFGYDYFGSHRSLEVIQFPDFGIGGVLWDCEFVLAHYLLKQDPQRWNGATAVEVGAGTGLAAMVAWQLGAFAVATDLQEVIETVTTVNTLRNSTDCDKVRRAMLHAHTLTWGVEEEAAAVVAMLPQRAPTKAKPPKRGDLPAKAERAAYDFIIAADVVYRSEDHAPLLATMATLANDNTVLIFAYRQRFSNDVNFLEPLMDTFEVLRQTPVADITKQYPKNNLTIFEFRLKRKEAVAKALKPNSQSHQQAQ